MNKKSDVDTKKFVNVFENLGRIERHNQTLMGIKKSEARAMLCVDYLSKKEEGKVTISEISKNLSIASPTVTELVKVLTKKGYLERKVNEKDKRFVEVALTDTGKKIVQDITQYYNDLFSGLVEKLGAQQSDLLVELLNQVNTYFDEWYKKD